MNRRPDVSVHSQCVLALNTPGFWEILNSLRRQFHSEHGTHRALYVCSDSALLFHLLVKTQDPVELVMDRLQRYCSFFVIYACVRMSRKGHVNLKQEPSTGQLQLVWGEANTDWLIKFDGRLRGHWADLWRGYTHVEIPPFPSFLDSIRQIETLIFSFSSLHHSF